MKRIYNSSFLIGAGLLILASCGDKQSPGLEYMPDMYRTPAVVAYAPSKVFKDSVSALPPVAGTIARGQYVDFNYPNTNEGYEAAGNELKNPFTPTPELIAYGKEEFTTYCAHCHGEKGDGNGWLKIKGDKFPVPSYFDDTHKDLAEGKMFFSITYGKNLMGSHASQLSPEDRWKIILFIKELQKEHAAGAATASN
ncbi:MAG: cytochrome c [Bacteroidetes bacterium]|jgi:mono/diheme cytochrome c family protein|nr:cytochrome c [Bacteroidota bacterium]